jgi:hypothetical protein
MGQDMMVDPIVKSLYEQSYFSLLNVLEEIFFDKNNNDFNWSRIKAFRYVMTLNSIAIRKQGDKNPYYTVPYTCRVEGNT